MVAAMPLQNDARPSEKTVTLRDLRRVAFGLSAAIMIVMIAGAINDDSGSSTATAELSENNIANYVFSIDAGQSNAIYAHNDDRAFPLVPCRISSILAYKWTVGHSSAVVHYK